MDFVSLAYVKSIPFLKPCTKKGHRHELPIIEGTGTAQVKTFRTYHLWVTIWDRYDHEVIIRQPFVAIERSLSDDPIILGRPIPKDLRINIDNEAGE